MKKNQHNQTALVTTPLSLKLWVHNSSGGDKEACEGVAWEEETPPGDAAGESQGGRQCRHATETRQPSRDWLEQRLSVLGLKVLGLKKKDSGLTRCSGPPGEQWQTHPLFFKDKIFKSIMLLVCYWSISKRFQLHPVYPCISFSKSNKIKSYS